MRDKNWGVPAGDGPAKSATSSPVFTSAVRPAPGAVSQPASASVTPAPSHDAPPSLLPPLAQGRIKQSQGEYPQFHFEALDAPKMEQFSATEIEHIDETLERLSNKSASEIRDYSHGDLPWRCAGELKALDYDFMFYRPDTYRRLDKPTKERLKVEALMEDVLPACKMLEEIDQGLHTEFAEEARKEFDLKLAEIKARQNQ